MKKLISILLIIMLLVSASLTGCGTNTPIDKLGTVSPGPETSDGTTPPQENVTLKFMGYNSEDSRKTYLENLDKEFPNITVEYQYMDKNQFDTVLNTQLAAGHGPDIIEAGGATSTLANAGYIEDLTNAPFTALYNETGLKPFKLDGKVYAIPLQSWFEAIFYNKAIFDNYDKKKKKTFDEFVAIHDNKAKLYKPRQWSKSWSQC